MQAKRKEGTQYTNGQIAEIALPFLDQFLKSPKKTSIPKLKALLELDHSIIVGANRCYDIVAVIERRLRWQWAFVFFLHPPLVYNMIDKGQKLGGSKGGRLCAIFNIETKRTD